VSYSNEGDSFNHQKLKIRSCLK